jgi:hypothetical protein
MPDRASHRGGNSVQRIMRLLLEGILRELPGSAIAPNLMNIGLRIDNYPIVVAANEVLPP